MWILTPQQPGGETHYLLPGKEYTVGRKNCDILLPNDQSISRVHAHLSAAEQTLTLKDSSKYGTFVNNQSLTAPVILKTEDNVTFGVFHSKFTVLHQKPVVCSSCLDNAGKASLTQALSALGGKLVNTWTHDCTHLAMPTVKVTIKTISALLCCRPIVKPEFFSELTSAVQQKSPPPKAESFLPEVDEPSLSKEDVNLGTIPARKQLFTGKTFLFLTAKQLKRLSAAVTFGGGRSQLLEEGFFPRDLLESPNSCVVDVTTGHSQNPLPPSSVEWASSVRSILQRQGRRVIPESEIGLAAIYTSCEKYCNPSCLMDSDSTPNITPRIPGASLSQNVAVNETVLPAASQNVTAYAANTEETQRVEVSEVTGVVAVGETPEKNQNAARFGGSRLSDPSVVADTASSSFSAADSRDSLRRRPDSKLTAGGRTDVSPQKFASKTGGGVNASFYKQSPQKLKASAQTSPQKQSTLTSFFRPVNKKRPLEDDLSAVMSEPKRPAPASSVTAQDSSTSSVSKEMPSLAAGSPPAVSETPLESLADSFVGRSQARSEEPRSRKRKEVKEEIKMEELESIMSMDIDGFDDSVPSSQGQQEQLKVHSLAEQNRGTVESLSKRQRLHQRENGTSRQKPEGNLTKDSSVQQNPSEQSERHKVSVKTEPIWVAETPRGEHESSKLAEAGTSKNMKPFEDDEASIIEDEELLQVDLSQPGDEAKAAVKPVVVKQEVQESKFDEGLPKKLVLVEFRSLTVTSPTTKPKQIQENGHGRNFKCFRKKRVPGADGSLHIIGGSDLLVHNRGKNSDLDEWLKDAVEEERQSRRDETIGDDLFRYNPTKLTKRR
ncbi:nibrin [Kryptolebias marmoratus]|uniref:Nibrin n=1 Tax=Kryptolebias marmoratus TaxID=37003 RepID=A0A3Q2ZN18_KRYMA|nr:nibrin [Kryptolebias marmoratus]